jgi:lantibiotic modifying enzyme
MINKKPTVDTIINYILEELNQNLDKIDNSSFDMGLPGIALFYYYLFLYTNDEKYFNLYIKLVDKTIKMLSSLENSDFDKKYSTDSIDNHLAGFGRFLIFSEVKLNKELDFNELLEELDTVLTPLLYSKLKIKDFDIHSGALASGNYFLARYKQTKLTKHKKILTDLEFAINNSAHRNNLGTYWKSPSLYNKVFLGLSHGSSMIINFLSKMVECKINVDETNTSIINGVKFIINNKREQINGIFPHCYFSDITEEKKETQFSQCYGDLGIGYSLLKSGSTMKNEIIYNEGLEILKKCAIRKKDAKLTEDASLVYGASGVACIFDEIILIDKDPLFENASNYWFETISSYVEIKNKDKLGFKSMFNINEPNWNNSFGWGLAGIGTSLIRSTDKSKFPSFNELLMIGS